jgi:hypothetical protein
MGVCRPAHCGPRTVIVAAAIDRNPKLRYTGSGRRARGPRGPATRSSPRPRAWSRCRWHSSSPARSTPRRLDGRAHQRATPRRSGPDLRPHCPQIQPDAELTLTFEQPDTRELQGMPTPRSSVERVGNAVMAIVRPVRLALAADVGYELIGAGMLILAGGGRGFPLDYDELERWTRVGYEPGCDQAKASGDLDSPRQSLPWIATHQKNRPQSPTHRVIERGDDLGLLRSPPFGAHRFLSFYRPSSVGTLLAFRSEVGQRVDHVFCPAEQLRLMPVQPSSFALCLSSRAASPYACT